jgi:hypothetical protein
LNDPTKVLVHDLDLSIVAPGTGATHWPWTLNRGTPGAAAVRTQRNEVDNVEQVVIDAPSPAVYIVRVGHTGGSFSQDYSLLISGLIPCSHPVDLDGDCDVDYQDQIIFEGCAASSGPTVPQTNPLCADADLDGDGDNDQSDFGIVQGCTSGNGVPAEPGCAP